jgi:hypothetical protein
VDSHKNLFSPPRDSRKSTMAHQGSADENVFNGD